MTKRFLSILTSIFIFMPNLHAYNLRRIEGGIKGRMINSVYQDKDGFMYIGTNVGVNIYDGKNAILENGYPGVTYLSGTSTDEIFIQSLYGFKIFSKKSDLASSFNMFNNVSHSVSDSRGTVFIIQGNGGIYYKTILQTTFDNVIVNDLISEKIKDLFVYDDTLLIVTEYGSLRLFEIKYDAEIFMLNEKPEIKIPKTLFCFQNDNHIYIVDNDYQLTDFDLTTNQNSFIADLKPILADKGKITSCVVFRNEFYFGTEAGLFKMNEDKILKVPIKNGITCLMKDRYQELIWIGTAGDGLYTYSYNPYSIKSTFFSDFSPAISKPVTAITTNETELWLGTEGDGIIVIPDYNPDNDLFDVKQLTTKNGLPDNTVHALHRGNDGIWIGCETGLAFYSLKGKTLKSISDYLLEDIRDIYQHETELWLACYTKGIVKADIVLNNRQRISETKLYALNNGDEASNRFTSIDVENDEIRFINEGNGIFEFTGNSLMKLVSDDDRMDYVNNLCALNKTEYILSTDFGIARVTMNRQKADRVDFFSNLASKDIISGNWNDYWISSDDGLMLYNTYYNAMRYFEKSYGVEIEEYSKGASFKDVDKGIGYFGGINGFTSIKYNSDYDEATDYMPTLFPGSFSLFGIDRNINNFIRSGKLVLKSNENLFSISFNALDYINGNNYIYYYKIGENGPWIDNGNSGTISFTDINPGSFNLFVKYYNKVLNKESYAIEFPITIQWPWYRTTLAYSIYFTIAILIIGIVYSAVVKRRRKLREDDRLKAEQRRKEEIYEAKLDFFTDMAHEFCTPLTLISGPCNLILEQKNVAPSIAKYAELINRNAKRMNSLINDLMNFKQMESGYKQPEITTLNVAEVADRIVDAFQINASGDRIVIKKHYDAGISWNSDEGFLTTILVNLISNAVKYSSNGNIFVEISTTNEGLKIKVTNEGEGITKDDISKIFNKYTVLERHDLNDWKQNGLGLAITASMIKLLKGKIKVESMPDISTSFIVCLPLLEVNADSLPEKRIPIYDTATVRKFIIPKTKFEQKEDRSTVAVIDDNAEMLWYICDMLIHEFNVIPINNPKEAIETIHANRVDIILCDLMMDELNGIQFTEILKSNKETSHIPLIIVSAAHDIEVQTEAINAGAELFITKPFDNSYLKSALKRLLGRKEDLKDYFSSPLSAYELSMGKLQHSEHRKFLKKIYGIINKNIENEELSPEFIATELGMSTRSLYRKLKETTDKGLLEIIRDGKLSVAENLLLKSKLTVDEIVHKSGFANRASFYRAFSKKNGCNPTEFVKKNGV